MRRRIVALGRLPVEAVPAAISAAMALVLDGTWRWVALGTAVAFTLILFRNTAGQRLLAAIVVTAFFAAAVFWDDGGEWRLAFVGAGVVSIWGAHLLGAIVWPDVAIIFLAGLAVVAVRDAREGQPKPEPGPPAVAVFELPSDQIRAPGSDLDAPSNVEVIALTPGRATEGGPVTHEATRFEALLLTSVPASGATVPVRVLIERGNEGVSTSDLAKARLDATEFVLLPADDCFAARNRVGLAPNRALDILRGHGFSEARAKEWVESFSGPIDFVSLRPGTQYNRYYSGSTVGPFLTDARFSTSDAARDGLELPETNQATMLQSVRVIAPAMTLRGRIRGGVRRALQFLVLRTACFHYGRGKPVEVRAP